MNEVYENMTDEQLVTDALKDDKILEYLIEKYKNFVLSKTRPYFLIGADKEDLIQEGMIGLYKAILDYNSTKKASFKTFADLCITRQIITAIKASTRQKHIPLNSYLSLDKPLFDEDTDITFGESMRSDLYNEPEERVIRDEKIENIKNAMSEVLSSMERDILKLYLSGKSYKEISAAVGKDQKAIDNALQRVKKKLEKHLRK